jgi:2-hydroxychromene-2-carboxylate isomerase
MTIVVDFHFDFASPYGFLAAMRIDAVLPRDRVRWRPFLLGAVYRNVGQSPLDHPLKRRYVIEIDVPRLARREGLTIKVPAGFPEHSLPVACAFYWIEARAPERAPDFATAAYRKFWLDGRSTADPEVALEAAAMLGFERAEVREGLQDEPVKQRLVAENEHALAKGVFGSPFFMVNGEPFWGSEWLVDVAERLAA